MSFYKTEAYRLAIKLCIKLNMMNIKPVYQLLKGKIYIKLGLPQKALEMFNFVLQ